MEDWRCLTEFTKIAFLCRHGPFFSHLQNVETKLMDRTAVKCVAAVKVVHNVITSMATVLTGVQRDTTEECAMMVS